MSEKDANAISGIPEQRPEQLQKLWTQQLRLQAVWLSGSQATGRHGPGSDINLCLGGPELGHNDRLALNAAVYGQPPWRDLVLCQELSAGLDAHVRRVGRRIWAAPTTPRRP